MGLSQKEKANLQAKAKLFPRNEKLRPTGLYLYNPANDQWYPAQCDDEGRLVIDPEDLDARYLKLDGSRPMTGSIGFPVTKGIYSTAYDFGIMFHTDSVRITNAALQAGVLKPLRCSELISGEDIRLLNGRALKGQGDYATTYNLFAGTAATTGGIVATVYANSAFGADDYRIVIYRAGDITMLAGKVLSGLGDVRAPSLPVADPADGLSKLWNNGNVVTVGT